MIRKRIIAVLATLDTKGEEVAHLRERLESLNGSAMIIDIGPLGPPGVAPDIDHGEVARRGGWELPALLQTGEKDRIMEVMGKGAGERLSPFFSREDRLFSCGGPGPWRWVRTSASPTTRTDLAEGTAKIAFIESQIKS